MTKWPKTSGNHDTEFATLVSGFCEQMSERYSQKGKYSAYNKSAKNAGLCKPGDIVEIYRYDGLYEKHAIFVTKVFNVPRGTVKCLVNGKVVIDLCY